MAAEKTRAIVLRVTEFSETSCVVTMMTRDFGKITAMAKGARRPKSPFEAAIDVLAICRIVFLSKSSGAMELLTEAKLERRFRGAESDVNRAYAGYYVVELLRCLTIEHDPHPEAFDLAHDMICRIDDGDFDQKRIVEFEIGLLSQLGHQPVFSRCASCGREREQQTRVSFSIDEGGVVCGRCRPGKRNVISLSGHAWSFLKNITEREPAEEKSLGKNRQAEDVNETKHGYLHSSNGSKDRDKKTDCRAETRQDTETEQDAVIPVGEIRQLMNRYINHLLNYPPRLQPYIGSIK